MWLVNPNLMAVKLRVTMRGFDVVALRVHQEASVYMSSVRSRIASYAGLVDVQYTIS